MWTGSLCLWRLLRGGWRDDRAHGRGVYSFANMMGSGWTEGSVVRGYIHMPVAIATSVSGRTIRKAVEGSTPMPTGVAWKMYGRTETLTADKMILFCATFYAHSNTRPVTNPNCKLEKINELYYSRIGLRAIPLDTSYFHSDDCKWLCCSRVWREEVCVKPS